MKNLLDPRDYRWTPHFTANDPFSAMVCRSDPLPVAVGAVFFDETLFDAMDWTTNGEQFSYYGTGRITQYSAVQLDNGSILFCMISGHSFGGTNSENDDIAMQYYMATPLQKVA